MLRVLVPSILALTLSSVALAQTPAPAPAAAAPFVRPPAPGRMIDIGGRKLHILCKGQGKGPTVIFEAGLSQYLAVSTYAKVQDLVAPYARACVYDRAGLGWSDPNPGVTSHQSMVADLHSLLRGAGIKGPIILVGHSMGGLTARLYAKTYPKEVAGMVLADASTEANFALPDFDSSNASMIAQIEAGLTKGVPGQPMVPLPAGTAYDISMAFTPEVFRTVKAEQVALTLVPAAMKQPHAYGTLGAKPLVILRRGQAASPPNADDIWWRTQQEKELSLSTNSQLVVAEKSGHTIPYEAPDLTAAAVRRVLDAVRTHGKLAAP